MVLSNDKKDLDMILAPFQVYCDSESLEQAQFNEMKEKLDKTLNNERAKYESSYKGNPRQCRKKWRDRRIKIYNYLLHIALCVSEDNQSLLTEKQEFTDDVYGIATGKLEPKTFYTYVVDQVHEDEEVMFKFYCVDRGLEKPFEWRKDAPWLVGSIIHYQQILIGEALNAMRRWKDGSRCLNKRLIKDAKEKFIDKVSNLHGRSFRKERHWRNRARFYYLLGLERHTGISNGSIGNYKNFGFEGPFCHLVREMIIEDDDLIEQGSKRQDLPFPSKTKYEKQNSKSSLGILMVNTLLAWASAANDCGFVKVLLKHYSDIAKSHSKFDFVWEKSVGESWAMALWNASYMGHVRIVQELLSWESPYHLYHSEYFLEEMKKSSHEPPLHIAVLKMDVSVVDAFCTKASELFNCNEKNSKDLTPLEIATKKEVSQKSKDVKRKIQNLLLRRQEVQNAVAEATMQRQLAVESSNAIMVGGTLITSITFAGWLQPPLGYNSYDQVDSNDSYMSLQGHFTIQLFAIFNSLSFYFAIASVIAGLETFGAMKLVEDIYVTKQVKKLRRKLTWATNLFLTSVVCVLAAFSCAGIAVLPPIKKYQINMYITISIGGFICMLFICKMVWYTLSKDFRNKVKSKFHLMSNK